MDPLSPPFAVVFQTQPLLFGLMTFFTNLLKMLSWFLNILAGLWYYLKVLQNTVNNLCF